MRSGILSASAALFLGFFVIAHPIVGAEIMTDRGRSPEPASSVMRSLVIDVLSKGLRSGSRPLLRRVLADTVFINGVAVEKEAAIASLPGFSLDNRGVRGLLGLG